MLHAQSIFALSVLIIISYTFKLQQSFKIIFYQKITEHAIHCLVPQQIR